MGILVPIGPAAQALISVMPEKVTVTMIQIALAILYVVMTTAFPTFHHQKVAGKALQIAVKVNRLYIIHTSVNGQYYEYTYTHIDTRSIFCI